MSGGMRARVCARVCARACACLLILPGDRKQAPLRGCRVHTEIPVAESKCLLMHVGLSIITDLARMHIYVSNVLLQFAL